MSRDIRLVLLVATYVYLAAKRNLYSTTKFTTSKFITRPARFRTLVVWCSSRFDFVHVSLGILHSKSHEIWSMTRKA